MLDRGSLDCCSLLLTLGRICDNESTPKKSAIANTPETIDTHFLF
jgi:hypothetical protein